MIDKRQTKLLEAFGDTPDQLVHCAFRYYLGRMTIATTCFARDLAKAWPHLDEMVGAMILRELKDEFERDDRERAAPKKKRLFARFPLGQDCDRAAWEKVRAAGEPISRGQGNG